MKLLTTVPAGFVHGIITLLLTGFCAVGIAGQESLFVADQPRQADACEVAITGTMAICAGGSTHLFATPGFDIYEWDTGESTQSIEVMAAGTYSVTVTDFDGSTCEASAVITVLDAPAFVIAGPSDVCHGNTVVICIEDPWPIYDYLWTTGETNPCIEVFGPGVYCLTITDESGCTSEGCIDIVYRDEIVPVISGDTTICMGAYSVLSASPGYTAYDWNNGAATQQISASVQEWDYCVTVTDAFGCTGSACVPVTDELPLEITGRSFVCAGESTVLTATGGYPHYLWSTGQDTPDIEVSEQGLYCVTVTDTTGCANTSCHNLAVRNVEIVVDKSPGVICPDQPLDLTAAVPGRADYFWSTGDSMQSISVGDPGMYCVTATQTLYPACTVWTCVEVSAWQEEEVIITGPSQFCSGTTALLEYTGHSTTIWWNTGEIGPLAYVSEGGHYSITVTDPCTTSTADFMIEEVDMLTPQIVHVPTCGPEDTLRLADTYYQWDYQWSTSEETSAITVPSGTYTVTVTDQSGCFGVATIQVTVESQITVDSVHILPDPGFGGGSIRLTGVSGDGPFSYQWSNGAQSMSAGLLLRGIYTVTITNNAGCAVVEEYYVPLKTAPDTDPTPRDQELTPFPQNVTGAGPAHIPRAVAFPNPFTSLIQFDLSHLDADRVQIAIIDIPGRTILMREEVPLGVIRLHVEGPAGVYFASITVDGQPAGVVRLVKADR